MAEEAKDTGAETPAAGEQPAESGEAKGAEGAQGTKQDVEATVPLTVVQKLREELKGLKENSANLESQNNLYKTQLQFMQQPQGLETPARPSAEDIKLALTPNVIYVIVSLQNTNGSAVKGFHISGIDVMEVPIKILER